MRVFAVERLLVAAAAIAFGAAALLRAEDAPITPASWFKFKPEAAADWKLVENPANGREFRIEAKEPAAGAPAPKRVMILFPKPSSSYDTATATILRLFGERRLPAVFTAVYFGSLKKDDKEKKAETDALGKAALERVVKESFDLLFSMGSESTDFVFANFRGQSVPVVSVCSKDPVLMKQMESYDKGSGTNFAFTSLNAPLDLQMIYLKRLEKDLKAIGILYDTKNKSVMDTQVEPLAKLAESEKVKIVRLAFVDPKKDKDQPDMKTQIAARMPAAIQELEQADPGLQNSLFWITGSTEVFNEIETINRHSGRVPVLSVVPDVVKEGEHSAVLSIGVSFESNAYLAGIYGLRILTGEAKPGNLPVGVVRPPDIAINFKRARAIDLKIPFSFFESAAIVYDADGVKVRDGGKTISRGDRPAAEKAPDPLPKPPGT